MMHTNFATSARYNVLKNETNPRRILIHGIRYLVTTDDADRVIVQQHKSILIEDGIIKKVFPKSKLRQEVKLETLDLIYDAEQKGGVVVTPGFINLHAHPPMYLLRATLGFDEDDLVKSLAGMARLEQQMTPDDFYLGALGDFTEEQKSGITLTVSHYGVFDPIEQAAIESRHRVINCVSAVSNSHPENTPEYVERYLKRKGTHTTPGLAIHYPWKANEEQLKKIAKLKKKYDCYLTTHVAEAIETTQPCIDRFGIRSVELLEKHGLLDKKTVMSHCVHLSDNEIKLIKKRKPVVVHMPTSNLIHRSGTFDYQAFKKAGAEKQIGFGTDSVVSKNRLDILSEALAAKTMHQLNTIVSYDELFKMCTSQAAAALGMKKLGRIAPGYRADIAFWKLKDRGMIPYNESTPKTLVMNLITHGSRHVRDLMIDGQFVISNRYHNTVDESKLLDRLQEAHMRMQALQK